MLRMRATVGSADGPLRYDFYLLPQGEQAYIELQPNGKWKLFRGSHGAEWSPHAEFESPTAAKWFLDQKFPTP